MKSQNLISKIIVSLVATINCAIINCSAITTSARQADIEKNCVYNEQIYANGERMPIFTECKNRTCFCEDGILACTDELGGCQEVVLLPEVQQQFAQTLEQQTNTNKISTNQNLKQQQATIANTKQEDKLLAFESKTLQVLDNSTNCSSTILNSLGDIYKTIAKRLNNSYLEIAWWAILLYAVLITIGFIITLNALVKRSSQAKLLISFPPPYNQYSYDQPKLVKIDN